MQSNIEYDKSFAVFSDVNHATTNATDNLFHESGKLQLNTYQAFITNVMNPRSDLRSLMLVHMTGTGKTITALATATEYVRQYQSDNTSLSSVIVLGFTKDIFKKELLSHPEFTFVNIDEVRDMKDLEVHMHDSSAVSEQYQFKKKQYQRRLGKREVHGIYQFYGYRQFANRVINMEDVQTMIKKQNASSNFFDLDAKTIKKWIESGEVRINTNYIKTFSRSLFICDEVHNLYKQDDLNTYGIAIQCVFDYFFKTLPTNDVNYGAVRSLLLSATPLTSSATEIIPIALLLTGNNLEKNKLFASVDGVDQLTQSGMATIRQSISGKISYIMDDNPSEYPSSTFTGDAIKNISYLKFIRTSPIGQQLKSFMNWSDRSNSVTDERGSNMIKDITLPPTKEHPHGNIFSKNIADLARLPDAVAVRKLSDGTLTSNIFKLSELRKYSCKYAKLIDMCLEMKGPKYGKMFIYHPFVQGSGTDLIVSLLYANGFVMDGEHPMKDSICMHCNDKFGTHTKTGSHEYVPVRFTVITGSIAKPAATSRLNSFNSTQNLYGEKLKIIVGSKAMRESHTLKTCKHVIVVHEPSSISEMIQIIGRAVRKRVHSMLPANMRSVLIHILSTNIENVKVAKDDPAANEELSYKMKVLQYSQINKIERIMYDTSLDYLINFRFKLRETPPLLGESYPLDTKLRNQYEKVLSRTYTDLRNGVAATGIHTNRFNVFHFESEVRLTMMIIKRIILDHQPAISILQLRDLVREPPFKVEYNTKLISNAAIANAVHKLTFRTDQLRIVTTSMKQSVIDSLYDDSSTLTDSHGHVYRIVCIGDPLCLRTTVTRRLLTSIEEGDNSLIDSFREVYSVKVDTPIDMKDLSEKWASTIDISDVMDDIKSLWPAFRDIDNMLSKFPLKIHSQLAEWAIKNAADLAINKVKIKDIDTIKYLLEFYLNKKIVFTIAQLKWTRVYDKYKRFDVDTGSSWFNPAAKLSTASLPIGHCIGTSVRLYQPTDKTWIELNSISVDTDAVHPYSFYMYEEKNGLSVTTKIKFLNEAKSKGIVMAFLQRSDLQRIIKELKINVSQEAHKPEIIQQIQASAWKIQLKLYPKRLIYRLIDL